jgi:translation initiation factor 1
MKISIRTERRKGNKIVTVVANIPHNPQVIEQWASELKKRCSVGGTIDKKNIELQGDQQLKVEAFLREKGAL